MMGDAHAEAWEVLSRKGLGLRDRMTRMRDSWLRCPCALAHAFAPLSWSPLFSLFGIMSEHRTRMCVVERLKVSLSMYL